MGFVFLCESCGKRLSVPPKLYEQRVRGRVVTITCRSCGAPIRVDGTIPPPPVEERPEGRVSQGAVGEPLLSSSGLESEVPPAPLLPSISTLPPPSPHGERRFGAARAGGSLAPPRPDGSRSSRPPGPVSPTSRLGTLGSVPPALPSSGRDSLSDADDDARAPIVEPQSESGWNAAPDAGTQLDVSEVAGEEQDRPGTPRISHAAGPISGRAPIAKIGRYALFDKFATGGMATVHLGRLDGAGGFSRVVAIKRLLPHLILNAEFAEMLLKEARLAARVRHPNVVPTLDVVALKHEVLLVLEYVHGESLSALCRAQSKLREWIPVPIVASVMIGALQGLHAVHEATDEKGQLLGLVHRDVSPPNVLIGTDGIARVLDFGIVKALEQMEETVPNRLKGKTGYMSPEQIRGERLTRSSDVFSAGIVLWELLTLRRFAPGPGDKQRLDRIARGNYQKPSEYRPSLPKAVDEVVMRALAFRPQDRYATARDFAEALGAAVEVASPGPVADWIARLAREPLAERARLLAQVENWDDEAHPPAETAGADSLALMAAPTGVTARANGASAKEPRPSAGSKGDAPRSEGKRSDANGKAEAGKADAKSEVSGRAEGRAAGASARAAQPSFAHLIAEPKSRASSLAPFAIALLFLVLMLVYFSTR